MMEVVNAISHSENWSIMVFLSKMKHTEILKTSIIKCQEFLDQSKL